MSHWRTDRPERIILVRHGESMGNQNKDAYGQTPDSQIKLTDRGFAQSAVCGLKLRKLIGNETVRFFHSPYMRARQSMFAILKAFDGLTVQVSSEPRLREQDFGNFQDPSKMASVMDDRSRFGRFFYRFENGEAGTDVFDRMATFIAYLFRTMGSTGYFQLAQTPMEEGSGARGLSRWGARLGSRPKPVQNYVLVTHGLLMRIFCMCYFRWTVTEFEEVWNPSNGDIWVLQKVQGKPEPTL